MIYEPFLEKTVGIAVGTFQNFGNGHNLKNIFFGKQFKHASQHKDINMHQNLVKFIEQFLEKSIYAIVQLKWN